MPANHVLLEEVTVGAAGAASIVFNSIPQTGYTDLIVKVSTRTTQAATLSNIKMTFNVSGGTYVRREMYAENGAVGTETVSDNVVGDTSGASTTANTFGSAEIYIPNYTSSVEKTFRFDSAAETNAVNSGMWLLHGKWSGTAAINSITLFSNVGNWAQHSTFTLYGVVRKDVTPTIAPFATGGQIINSDGTYWYHAFLSSGTFTPLKALSCDVLVVAGGGSAGGGDTGNANLGSGGGGAGGLVYAAAQSLLSGTAYTATVGAGGASVGQNASGNNGTNSTFGSLTAAVGGGAGRKYSGAGFAGGSGGGSSGNGVGGTATAGQGNAGGGPGDGSGAGAGGGGAGGAGGANASNAGGAGGAGVNTYSTWHSATATGVSGYIAGGGGGGAYNGFGTGGAGGAGGGGRGSGSDGALASGTANTGGGGGGVSSVVASGSGGSGIIIIRYPMV